MINICPNCKGVIGKETVCPKCGVNILDYKEELELKSAEPSGNIESNPPLLDKELVDADRQSTSKVFVGVTALVKCPACGRERVSDSAAACPECGFAVKAYFNKIRYDKEREAQMAAQEEMRRRRQEEYIARKKQRRNKLFGSPAKKAAWISVGCVVLGLFVLLGFHIHKEKEISKYIGYAKMDLRDIKEDVDKLQDELEDLYLVSGDKLTLLEEGQIENIEKLVANLNRNKRVIDNYCEFDRRVADSVDSYVKLTTSYKSWDEYKKFLANKYLVSNTPENSAAQLIKTRTYSSSEEAKRAKQSNSLFIDSLHMSSNSSYHIVSGSVTNNTSSIVKFVVVEIHLKDENGKTFDSDTVYACGEEGIRPGASAKFECHFDEDSRTERCSAWILRYD